MATANRSTRLRRLAGQLTEQFGLPWGDRAIEPHYDDSTRQWTFRWPDGPTAAQVRRAARKAQPEATEGLDYERRLTPQTYALGALRLALAAEPEDGDFRGPYIAPSHIDRHFEKAANPQPRSIRETRMMENLVTEAKQHGRGWADAAENICTYVTEKGLARLLTDAELEPLELLTASYAQGAAERAWRFRLVPLTPLEAFGAVQADPEPEPEAVAAALTLVPELHAAIDAAAAGLRSRAAPQNQEPASA